MRILNSSILTEALDADLEKMADELVEAFLSGSDIDVGTKDHRPDPDMGV